MGDAAAQAIPRVRGRTYTWMPKLRKRGEKILHSKYIVILVIILTITDCALVIAELILDLYSVKKTLSATENQTIQFIKIIRNRYPEDIVPTDSVAAIYDRIAHSNIVWNTSYDLDHQLLGQGHLSYQAMEPTPSGIVEMVTSKLPTIPMLGDRDSRLASSSDPYSKTVIVDTANASDRFRRSIDGSDTREHSDELSTFTNNDLDSRQESFDRMFDQFVLRYRRSLMNSNDPEDPADNDQENLPGQNDIQNNDTTSHLRTLQQLNEMISMHINKLLNTKTAAASKRKIHRSSQGGTAPLRNTRGAVPSKTPRKSQPKEASDDGETAMRQELNHSEGMEIAHKLHYASVGVVSILLIEVTMKIVCAGSHFLKRKIEVFDAVVIVASVVVDLIFIRGLSEFAVDDSIFVLAFLLPWRVIRVVNSLVMAVIDHEHVKLRLLYSRKKKLDRTVEHLRNEVDELKGLLQDIRQFCIKEGVEATTIDGLLGKFAPRRRKDSKFYTLVKLVMSTASINNNNDNVSISSSSMENDIRHYANRDSVLNDGSTCNDNTMTSLKQYLSVPLFSGDANSLSEIESTAGDLMGHSPSIFVTSPGSDDDDDDGGVFTFCDVEAEGEIDEGDVIMTHESPRHSSLRMEYEKSKDRVATLPVSADSSCTDLGTGWEGGAVECTVHTPVHGHLETNGNLGTSPEHSLERVNGIAGGGMGVSAAGDGDAHSVAKQQNAAAACTNKSSSPPPPHRSNTSSPPHAKANVNSNLTAPVSPDKQFLSVPEDTHSVIPQTALTISNSNLQTATMTKTTTNSTITANVTTTATPTTNNKIIMRHPLLTRHSSSLDSGNSHDLPLPPCPAFDMKRSESDFSGIQTCNIHDNNFQFLGSYGSPVPVKRPIRKLQKWPAERSPSDTSDTESSQLLKTNSVSSPFRTRHHSGEQHRKHRRRCQSERSRSQSPLPMKLLSVPGEEEPAAKPQSGMKQYQGSRSMHDVSVAGGRRERTSNSFGTDGKKLRSSCLSLNGDGRKKRGKSPHRVSFKVS